VDGLPTWRGELRSGFRANMLMGVTSNRVDVKHAAALAEVALERRAEPYSALFGEPADWPERLLELAWLGVVRNAAHDSICACSVDAVVDSVLERFAESHRIAVGSGRTGARALARSMAKAGPVVVNPSARTRSGIVELIVTGRARGRDVRAGAVLAGQPARARSPWTRPRSHRSSACCRAPASLTTRGCTTSGSKRTRPGST
jgi:hypothetical protein